MPLPYYLKTNKNHVINAYNIKTKPLFIKVREKTFIDIIILSVTNIAA